LTLAKTGIAQQQSTPAAKLSEMQAEYKRLLSDLSQLNDAFAAAANGDFSREIILSSKGPAGEVLAGAQMMIDVIRDKTSQLEGLNKALEETIAERTVQRNRSQSELQSVVDNAPNYIIMLDTDLRYTFINRSEGEVSVQELIGTTYGNFMVPKDRKRIHRLLKDVLKSGKMRQFEYRSTGLAEPAWYKNNAGPIYDDGKINGVVLITFDITREKTANEGLKREKMAAEGARLRDQALLNSIGGGLVVVNEQGQIANINPVASEMLGFKRRELIGKWFTRAIVALDDNDQPVDPLERPAMRALATGKPVTANTKYVRKDGTTLPVALTISPVVLHGRPIGAIEVFRDITRELELDRAKEEFVSLASHQLRTPASGIKAYVSMLLDGYVGELSPQQRELLQKVFHSNERQLQVVNDMLNVARLDSGRIVPEMATVDLCQMITDVADEQQPIIASRKQYLNLDLPAKKIEAVLDAKLVRMVIENLLSNASKYTPEDGKLTITLSRLNSAIASVAIKDTGVGIDKTDMPKLFQRFARIPNRLSATRGGTGLGLYLTQTIVLLHNGSMAVESTPGRGTTFTIHLPLRPSRKDNEKEISSGN
jgi:PAS domain S-box-containing protein